MKDALKRKNEFLTGYKGNPKTNWRKFQEALIPKQVAISLTGEPTLYEPLGELIRTFPPKGINNFSSFQRHSSQVNFQNLAKNPVNSTFHCVHQTSKPTRRICRPEFPSAWAKLNETLDSLQSFHCPTVLRMTLVKEHNMSGIDEYAKLVKKANPTYIEAKAYMHIGFSHLRLSLTACQLHPEVRTFAEELAEKTGYKIVNEAPESRVVLLSRLEKAYSGWQQLTNTALCWINLNT